MLIGYCMFTFFMVSYIDNMNLWSHDNGSLLEWMFIAPTEGKCKLAEGKGKNENNIYYHRAPTFLFEANLNPNWRLQSPN